jgi:predicted TIM-barrel fold metal-dependent hydrolase
LVAGLGEVLLYIEWCEINAGLRRRLTPRGSLKHSELANPPARKFPLTIIDAHVHLTDSPSSDLLVEIARRYGVSRLISVSSLADSGPLHERHGKFINFALWPDYEQLEDAAVFRRVNREIMEQGRENGAVGMKFWFKPQFNHDRGLYLDDARLRPLFEDMAERELTGLVHIADPDIWFRRVYSDEEKYLSKRDNYRQLTGVLGAFPRLNIVAAHFGGDPEDLPHLAEMLAEFPNLYLDTSATKWLARELSAKRDQARSFIIEHADRLLFGTDLVTFQDRDDDYFASRYYVQQRLWEDDGEFISPIEDGDAGKEVLVRCMDLPKNVLKKIYYDNAMRVYRLK